MALVHTMDFQKQENKDTDKNERNQKVAYCTLLIPLILYLSPTYNPKNKFEFVTILFHFLKTFFYIYNKTSFPYPAPHIYRFKMNWPHNTRLLRLSSILIFYFRPYKPFISDSKFNILQLSFSPLTCLLVCRLT